ncbi:3-isopropylmalate dehydrogenase (EC [Bathymodiolus thermophilus thioautotrophic gill symbiont]|jgi:3-isopropylmalate dehydrogenase|uniref:3-isopropylmalate dehydrogenase n=2 Tax=sulfur-oxidizing symbionts TaxID=32036 RepID=A0A1H6MAH1_9GAMM|nr:MULTISPECIES: 3-isopropylmalate dehydrogenase [sulfur-oxidizing symbionts]CAC5820108.1 3-isopropylmalate dehydrogenase (EC 1.1.1.85) [uncultured Gammaproteobacteria bacterium]CAB5505083.1 3-isopropylmalate dehydrogenase (EC [Bathymodiolus thermophilus thioautotrophic gill symbiont]CAC9503314.1 3-isopropylmalate dehydrogenase (EC 1.1.1.85) [uncultured Gammaproteobacteria bacterium]CAC9514366.1 3-isopropylmalate dehydrogenase (EC 1.1.1.85) [uncultured Gammaproteobacteria bacterium]CAC9532838.
MSKVLILPGDGIGQEIVAQALKVIDYLNENHELNMALVHGLVGGSAYDETASPLPQATLDAAHECDSILLGAVGGYQWEKLERDLRPERGLLGLRVELDLFSNLRPAILYPQLASASTLKEEVVSGLDLMIVRELVAGIYFGQPRGVEVRDGEKYGFNTATYFKSEIERIGHSAFKIAQLRNKRVCSVDKANVLEVCELWRETMIEVAKDYPDVELSHMYVDNAAMQLVKAPKQFDVMVTSNLFGDVLSDCAAMLTGSIGMLPSASLNKEGFGMYEPIHGSAPDIAGQDLANPLATILSVAMMLRYSLNQVTLAEKIEAAVNTVLDKGYRTQDIASESDTVVGTDKMGDLVVEAL